SPAEPGGPAARRRPAGVARLAPAPTQAVPVPLRPLTLGEILDGGFDTLRISPGLILGLAAAVVVPAELVSTWFERDLLDGNPWRYVVDRPWRFLIDSGTGTVDPSAAAMLVGFALALVVPALVAVAVGRVLSAWYAGTQITGAAATATLVRRGWVVLLLAPVRAAAGLVLFGVPLVLLVLTGPVVGIEGVGPAEALARSSRLVTRRFGSALGFYLLSAFLFILLTASLNLVALVFAEIFLGGLGWVLLVCASIGVRVLLTAFLAAATCLLYLDSRVRVEGLDLELMLIDEWPAARR
ncbi:MAG: hypothetical protein OES57_15995, partial [Acidimicrobiia bacterium]|nr:hypothetical protein [Acidimicrobiia bacterium]